MGLPKSEKPVTPKGVTLDGYPPSFSERVKERRAARAADAATHAKAKSGQRRATSIPESVPAVNASR